MAKKDYSRLIKQRQKAPGHNGNVQVFEQGLYSIWISVNISGDRGDAEYSTWAHTKNCFTGFLVLVLRAKEVIIDL